eukprot:8040572-Heterocapsa_arctica.AAC.1
MDTWASTDEGIYQKTLQDVRAGNDKTHAFLSFVSVPSASAQLPNRGDALKCKRFVLRVVVVVVVVV